MNRNELDIAWTAGFVDGEGHIKFFTAKSGVKAGYSRFVLDVSQVDRRPLDELARIFGGKVYGPYAPRTAKSRPYYKWIVHSRIAKGALDQMRPFLRVKREQADAAYERYNRYQLVASAKSGPGLHAAGKRAFRE